MKNCLLIKKIIMLFLLIYLIAFNQIPGKSQWIVLDNKPISAISGAAVYNDFFLVIHDNKKDGQPRISLLDEKNNLHALNWPTKTLPFDLEGLHKIPGFYNQFLAMESSGKCYRFIFDNKKKDITLVSNFQLPELTNKMNLEGIALFPIGKKIKIAYGDRGSTKRKSTLFIGDFDSKNNEVINVFTYSIGFSEPKTHRRNIADLEFDKSGTLWCSATSDPGDDGPFETRLYKIGNFLPSEVFKQFNLFDPKFEFINQKVEAMTYNDFKMILLTDNEKMGSSIYYLQLE